MNFKLPKKIILPIGVLAVVLIIATIISFILIAYLGSNGMTFNLSSFNWEGVDGITNIFMTVVTMVFLYGIIQAKETHAESAKARKQATNASDAEVLRWAMDEMSKRKDHIRLVTDAYKEELENILIKDYKFKSTSESCESKTHKYQLRKSRPKYTDEDRMTFVKSMDDNKQKEFYSKAKEINGNKWNQEIKDALHKEVSIIMQRMGYMALFGLISKQHFINLWGPMFLASWYSIKWYIKKEREKLGENDKNIDNVEEFIQMFGDGGDNKDYDGAFFRIHLEAFIIECENKLPIELVNNERLKFGIEDKPKT